MPIGGGSSGRSAAKVPQVGEIQMDGPGNGPRVATRAQVLALLEAGQSYETVGRALGIPPGLAFMIAPRVPADRSDPAAAAERARKAAPAAPRPAPPQAPAGHT